MPFRFKTNWRDYGAGLEKGDKYFNAALILLGKILLSGIFVLQAASVRALAPVLLAFQIRIKHPAECVVFGEALDAVPFPAFDDHFLKRPHPDAVVPAWLRFKLDDNNNAIANYLSLYSGNATLAADRPQLVITYIVP